MEPICKVFKCRFNYSHNTSMHLCGICNKLGHGQIECRNQFYIDKLKDDIDYNKHLNPSLWCSVNGCNNKETHSITAHFCQFCKMKECKTLCPHNPNNQQVIKSISCPLCRCNNDIYNNTNLTLFGVDTKCSICLINECNIILPICRHVCMCNTCFSML